MSLEKSYKAKIKKNLNSYNILLLVGFSALLVGLIYSSHIRHATECRADILFKRINLHSYNVPLIRTLVENEVVFKEFSEEKIHKATVLIDFVNENLLIILALRITQKVKNQNVKNFEIKLNKSFNLLASDFGVKDIKSRINCFMKPQWHEHLTAFSLTIVFLIYILLRRTLQRS